MLEGLRKEALAMLAKSSRAGILEPRRTQRITQAGGAVEVSIISTSLVNEAGERYANATTEWGDSERQAVNNVG